MYGISGMDAECALYVRSCLAHSFQAEKMREEIDSLKVKLPVTDRDESRPRIYFILFIIISVVITFVVEICCY